MRWPLRPITRVPAVGVLPGVVRNAVAFVLLGLPAGQDLRDLLRAVVFFCDDQSHCISSRIGAHRPKRLARVAAVLVGREATFPACKQLFEAREEAEVLKVLVTGGAGFIGSNLVDALLERGDRWSCSTTSRPGRKSNLEPRDRATARSWSSRTSATASRWRRCSRSRSPRSSSTSPLRSTCACRPREPVVRRRGERDRHDQHARGGASQRGAAVRVRVDRRRDLRRDRRACRRRRARRSAPRLPTARPSTPARATCRCGGGCTACRPSACASATSTARARTRSARPA